MRSLSTRKEAWRSKVLLVFNCFCEKLYHRCLTEHHMPLISNIFRRHLAKLNHLPCFENSFLRALKQSWCFLENVCNILEKKLFAMKLLAFFKKIICSTLLFQVSLRPTFFGQPQIAAAAFSGLESF